jgi:hypothetical protein
MRRHAGILLAAAVLSTTVLVVRPSAQSLTLPDWMHSSQRDLPPEVFPTRTSTPPAAAAPALSAADVQRLFADVVCAVGPTCEPASRAVVFPSQVGPEADILTKL